MTNISAYSILVYAEKLVGLGLNQRFPRTDTLWCLHKHSTKEVAIQRTIYFTLHIYIYKIKCTYQYYKDPLRKNVQGIFSR